MTDDHISFKLHYTNKFCFLVVICLLYNTMQSEVSCEPEAGGYNGTNVFYRNLTWLN